MANHLDPIGQQVGDYLVLRWLGGGGFGDVYLAEQIRDHSQVAIKLLHIRLSSREELKAFINEARTMRLKHAHIVPLLDFDISREEIPFLVMEYVAQGTLRNRHPKGSQVPFPLVVDYAQQVGSALQYAHEQRLIHRDVKPENMLLREDGTVLLSDFGMVTAVHSSDSLGLHQGMGGTIPYMAPEQIQGQARAASDQYGLGVVVYEWITGHRPFEGTVTEVAMQHVMKPPPSLLTQVSTPSSAIEAVVLKALAKDPKDRFATVQDFTAALEETVRGAPNISSSFILHQSPPPVMPSQYNTSPIGDNESSVLLPDTGILSVPSLRPSPASGPRVDWGDALTVPTFYGREEEQALLYQWVVQERCRLVSVLGMGGIGKSALVISITNRLVVGVDRQAQGKGTVETVPCACPFEVVIVRSLRNAPSCEVLLDDCLQVLSPQSQGLPAPATLERRISVLLSLLRKMRVLLVLDNLEGLLETGDVRGHFRPGFEGYEHLLHHVAETAHQSCLLLTSREKPAVLRPLGSRYPSVHSLRLAGLSVIACKQLLEEKGVVGTESEQKQLVEVYAGNPLALKIVTEPIIDLFGGEIGPFLAENMVIFGSITDLLDEQFARLSPQEQSVLYWLAIMREPVTLGELQALLVTPQPRVQVLEAVDAGYRRSLIERGKRSGSFTLQSVVLEYVTAFLIEEGSREVQQGRLDKLIQYGLEQAHAKEYVRQMQQRLLVCQLLAELHYKYPRREAVEAQLLSLLNQLREEADDVQGYGPANLIALLWAQRGNLSGLDLSLLSIRGAYLQSIEMQDTSLVGSLIRNTVFTEAVSATRAVTISRDGKWWAASGMQGKVCIWDGGGQHLQRIWQAHTDMVQALTFSPDGRTLASCSMDGTVKLWDVEACSRAEAVETVSCACLGQGALRSGPHSPRGALLWTGWQNSPQSLAFTPDSSLLASCGLDATVRLWDPQSGANLQTLTHPGPVVTVAWSSDGDLLASGGCYEEIRLWERQKTEPAACVEILQLSTSWVTNPVMSLAFVPNGRTLASANADQTIKLWDVPSGCLLHTFPGQTNLTNRVVWSPDGHTLASFSYDQTIWLWDVERGCRRTSPLGHTSHINSMAFTPDSSHLLSGSADSNLRVWDLQSGQCVRVIAGYAVSLYNLDWSPDGKHLLSGGTDGLVTIWDLSGGTQPRVLYGHTSIVSGVGWSPDGRFLASCGWDAVIRLWNPTSGSCIQKFEVLSAVFLCAAWSPDGHLLACGTFLQGMQVWDMTTHRLCWVEQSHQVAFLHVAWSPDGTKLAGGGTDGSVYLWEGADGTPLQCLPGHQGRVTCVAWSPDGTQLASGSGDGGSGELFVWAVKTGERVQNFEGHPGTVYMLAWSRSQADVVGRDLVPLHPCACPGQATVPTGPHRDQLVTGGSDGQLRWWDVQRGECVSTQVAHQGTIRSLRVSPDGRQLASCGDDGAIMIWELCSGELIQTLRGDRPYERLNITGIRGLTEAQKSSLQALGAIECD